MPSTRIVLMSALLVVAASVALILIFAGTTGAQYDENANEDFRSQLADYYADLVELYPYIAAGAPPNLLEDLQKVQQAIPEYTHEELTIFRNAVADNPDFWLLPELIHSTLGPDAQGAQTTTGGEPLQSGQGSLTSHTCPAGTPLGVTDEFIARGVALAAAAVMEGFPTDGLTILLRLAPIAAWVVTEVAVLALEGVNAVADECELNNHLDIEHDIVGPRVDEAVSTRATQTSLTDHDTNIDGDLVTHNTALGAHETPQAVHRTALTAHNTNIDQDLVNHDANIDQDLINHDANIDQDLVNHDANIDQDLVNHDANIDQDLIDHDANIDQDLINHDANIDADLVAHDTDIKGLVGGVQNTLNTTTEEKRVHLQVIDIEEKNRFLLGSDEAGVPVDVTLIGLRVSNGKMTNNPLAFQDQFSNATPTSVGSGTGLLDVEIDLSNNAKDAKIYQFRVRHDHGADPAHFGVVLLHLNSHNNLGAGQ